MILWFNRRKILNVFRKLFSPFIRYSLFIYDVFVFRNMFSKLRYDRLMIVAGGYPGGDSCRAAAIAWGILNGKGQVIYNFHNLAVKPRWHEKVFEKIIDSLIVKYVKFFVTVSSAAANSMFVRPVINKTKRVLYIYNGIDVTNSLSNNIKISLRNELNLTSNSKICLMMGSYEPRKGHEFLLNAFKNVLGNEKNVYLIMCGYGYQQEVQRVQMLIDKMQLNDNVRLMGFRDDIVNHLKEIDLLLVPSQAFESFGLMCVEAMANKIPVVATNVGGLPEVISDGEGGYIVESQDVNGFADKILMLLKDENLRKEQGEKGFLRFKANFEAAIMTSKYAKLIYEN